MTQALELVPIPGLPEVQPGDDISGLLVQAMQEQEISIVDGDILVLAQKIISKAENTYRYLDEVEPSDHARELAVQCDKDPALVQLILDESEEILRLRPGVIVVQHKLGYVHANAGIDRSNLPESNRERVLLLPGNPDASAESVRQAFKKILGVDIAVIINDSAGRAWRVGTVGFAIGTAGFQPLVDMVGRKDRNGRVMEVTEVAVADELAAAASFLMGQADEGLPVVLIKGANIQQGQFSSSSLIRDKATDLFR